MSYSPSSVKNITPHRAAKAARSARIRRCGLCGAHALVPSLRDPTSGFCETERGGCGRDSYVDEGHVDPWGGRRDPDPEPWDVVAERWKDAAATRRPVPYDLRSQHRLVQRRTRALQRTTTLRGERIGPAADWETITWSLPHQGTQERSCGRANNIGHGDGPTIHRRVFVFGCKRASCSVCRPRRYDDDPTLPRGACWEHDRSWAGTERIEAWIKEANEPYEKMHVPTPVWAAYHVIISPPQAAAASLMRYAPGYAALRTAAVAVAKARGVQGGLMVFHHQRCPGRWNNRRAAADGPHWHVITTRKSGLSRPLVRTQHRRDGWIAKDAGRRATVYGTLYYILTHAAVATLTPPGAHPALPNGRGIVDSRRRGPASITWFGDLAYNRFTHERVRPDGLLCPICDERIPLPDWERLRWTHTDRPPPDAMIIDLRHDAGWARSDADPFSLEHDETVDEAPTVGPTEYDTRLAAARERVARQRRADAARDRDVRGDGWDGKFLTHGETTGYR